MRTSRGRSIARAAPLALALLGATDPAEARVVRFVIETRELVADGAPFGDAGPYELVRGHAELAIDPKDPRNAVVFDLDKAPVNARGEVELAADVMLLRPTASPSDTLFVEIPNRGHVLTLALLDDAIAGSSSEHPRRARDVGNGWLLRRGSTIAWIGWQADVLAGDGRLTVRVPSALENGKPVRGRNVIELSDRSMEAGDTSPFSLPLGGRGYASIASASLDPAAANAVLRVRPSDSPRPSDALVPEGTIVPRERWSFASCPNGPPGTPSTTDLCVFDRIDQDHVYELSYDAAGSPIFGLGYVATRDVVSFLRGGARAEGGTPLTSGVRVVLGEGISQTGAFLRDFVYQGFNEDEHGARVFDGLHIHATGANKLGLNVRFSRANWGSIQHSNRLLADAGFPRAYAVRHDARSSDDDGLLRRPATDPKILHSDTANEWWNRRASLVDTTDDGGADAEQPAGVRRYLFSSLQHFTRKGKTPGHGNFDMCKEPSNVTHGGVLARALVDALDAWVRRGVAPPASRVPRIADGTLVEATRYEALFPKIPGVAATSLVNAFGELDFGPSMRKNRGLYDRDRPTLLARARVLVPAPDDVGNDRGGVRHPFVEAPIATLTGWSVRKKGFVEGDLCGDNGQTLALASTRAARLAAGDARPSLEELYATHAGYVAKVRAAAERLVADRLMLAEDVDALVAEADARDVLRDVVPPARTQPPRVPPRAATGCTCDAVGARGTFDSTHALGALALFAFLHARARDRRRSRC